MGWNLPPGCTQAEIDRAHQGDDEPNDEREVLWKVRGTMTIEVEGYVLAATYAEALRLATELKRADFDPAAIGWCDDLQIETVEPHTDE